MIDNKGQIKSTPGKIEICIGGSQPDKETTLSGKTIAKTIEII